MYDLLAVTLRKNHISQRRLAEHLALSASSLSSRMNGRTGWRLEEAFATLDLLGVSHKFLPEFFGEVATTDIKEDY